MVEIAEGQTQHHEANTKHLLTPVMTGPKKTIGGRSKERTGRNASSLILLYLNLIAISLTPPGVRESDDRLLPLNLRFVNIKYKVNLQVYNLQLTYKIH